MLRKLSAKEQSLVESEEFFFIENGKKCVSGNLSTCSQATKESSIDPGPNHATASGGPAMSDIRAMMLAFPDTLTDTTAARQNSKSSAKGAYGRFLAYLPRAFYWPSRKSQGEET